MPYLYETHLHTCQSSACGRASGAEHARKYKQRGYSGIIVTDHFFGGNTAASLTGNWEKRVNEFCAGYEDAKAEGDRIGLDVFFGWEETFDGDDYLVYGLDKEWLLAHPEVEHWTRKRQYEQVHKYGGCVIQAHPFRCRDYISRIHLAPKLADGVEIANAGNLPLWDYYARIYAEEFGMMMISGSDNHFSIPGCQLFGIESTHRFASIQDMVNTVMQRETIRLPVPEERFLPVQDKRLPIQSWIFDENEQLTRFSRPWLED